MWSNEDDELRGDPDTSMAYQMGIFVIVMFALGLILWPYLF